jgi:GTP-binding protein Era
VSGAPGDPEGQAPRGPAGDPEGQALRGPAGDPEGQALRGPADDPEGQALRGPAGDPEGQALRAPADDPEGQALRAMRHRAGVVALLGAPNVGKSTLLNRLLGEKLAIVTAKPQTTRSRLLGILTRPDAQLLLLDTPGFLDGARPLDRSMRDAAGRAADDCDTALLLVDPSRGFGAAHGEWMRRLASRGAPVLVVATQVDRADAARAPWPPPEAAGAAATLRVSARTGEGVDALVEAIVAGLPEAPPYYPADQLTDRPLRFLAAEAIREAAFEELAQELPYRIAVEMLAFDESDPALVRLGANLLVERESQKRIAVGRGGEKVRAIGTRARREIERLLGTHVHLALWVKVDPHWARSAKRLKSLGYC